MARGVFVMMLENIHCVDILLLPLQNLDYRIQRSQIIRIMFLTVSPRPNGVTSNDPGTAPIFVHISTVCEIHMNPIAKTSTKEITVNVARHQAPPNSSTFVAVSHCMKSCFTSVAAQITACPT